VAGVLLLASPSQLAGLQKPLAGEGPRAQLLGGPREQDPAAEPTVGGGSLAVAEGRLRALGMAGSHPFAPTLCACLWARSTAAARLGSAYNFVKFISAAALAK